jgi:AAHS family 4-hydroxybenzoate transporter-like MFS transporter
MNTLELSEEIEGAPIARHHRLVVGTLALATLFDGYNVFVPAYVIPYVGSWHLQPSEAGLLVSCGLVGFMLGALATGALADRVGRKPTLIGALWFASAANLATALWGDSFGRFLILRLATGLGLGMILPVSVTLVNELAPRRRVNVLVGWMMTGWSIGGVIAALLALALIPTRGWPALFAAGAIAAPAIALIALALPESPRFLAARGRDTALRAVMARLVPARAGAYVDVTFSAPAASGRTGSLARLLSPQYRRGTLILWTCSALSLFTIFGLSSWIPDILLRRGLPLGASFSLSAWLQLTALLGGLGCGWAADRAGRDPVLKSSWVLGAGALAGLACFETTASNLAFVAVAGFCVMGAQTVLNNRTAALYPTEIRSTGVGSQLGIGRLGGILGPYVGGWLQQLFPGSRALLLALAVAIGGSVLSLMLLPAVRAPQSVPSG